LKSKSSILYLIVFFALNFGALYIGALLSGEGAFSDWYQSSKKAPWTPDGWVFGAAWSFIMICFSFFMSICLIKVEHKKQLIGLFLVQWIINVMWNPTFFYFHNAVGGLVLILILTVLIGFIFINYLKTIKYYSLLILPYLLWLIIASSLNMYIVIFN
tara:strand:- start:1964 stop:2437 length:474 start_codon:yes stop_codon:yes gene_type:complete